MIRVPARYLFMDPEDRLMKFPAVLALDERLRQRLSIEARDYARDWSTTIMSRRMAGFYRRVVEQENGALVTSTAGPTESRPGSVTAAATSSPVRGAGCAATP